MQWVKEQTTSTNEIFSLVKNGQKLLRLDFHHGTNSARIEYDGKKRVFMIRKEGFRKHKTVLCNEYGVRLGELENTERVSFLQSTLTLTLNWFLSLPATAPKPASQIVQEMDHVHP